MNHHLRTALALAFSATTLIAQTSPSTGFEGRWEGRLGAGLRLRLDITKTTDGLYFGTLTSLDQGGSPIAMDSVAVIGDSIEFGIRSLRVTYAGAVSADRARLAGTWMQVTQRRLEFMRVAVPPGPAPAPGNASTIFGVAAELSVPVPPTLFAGAGKQHLVYEIHIANHSGAELLLSRLEILDDNAALARWEGLSLHTIVAQRRPNVTDNRAIPAGGWAVAHVWVTIDSGARVPAMLRHRLTVGGQSLEGTVTIAAASAIVIGPPLRGADWVAQNGPDNIGGHHRRALVPIGGKTYIAQRFATDWMQVAPNGRPFDGDQRDNKSYFGYGKDVIAVADAVVASTKDGIAENIPGADSRAAPIAAETVGGNYVVLDLGQGRYAFYAHLIPGSVRVKPGDRVKRGDVIGLVGNSGNSTGPHLHFHVSDRSSPLESEGLPFVIDSWDLMRAPGQWERRTNEIPLQNARVRFPGG